MSAPIVLDHDWTDDDDEPLGGWVQIDRDEWRAILTEAGGVRALQVFSTLTDPDGDYGSPQIYTAWGRREDRHPLVDIRDYKEQGRTSESTLRKFVRVETEASA
jgi:hypothetical protein